MSIIRGGTAIAIAILGAQEVLLSSRNRIALMTELRGAEEPTLEALLERLAPVDLVLVEGYKRDRHPKIEAHRAETGQPLIAPGDETIRAVASDSAGALPEGLDRPVFDLTTPPPLPISSSERSGFDGI